MQKYARVTSTIDASLKERIERELADGGRLRLRGFRSISSYLEYCARQDMEGRTAEA